METNFSALESRKNIDLFANKKTTFRYVDIHLTTSYINQDSPHTMSILGRIISSANEAALPCSTRKRQPNSVLNFLMYRYDL